MKVKTYFLLLSILLTLNCFSQSYANYIDWDKQSIIENFNSLSKKNKNYIVETKDSVNMLVVCIKGFENIRCEFQFDEEGNCFESFFIYSCSDCMKKHIDEFLNNKYFGWKKVSENNYYSKYKLKQAMALNEKKEETSCFTIIFTKVYWTKEEYKNKIKK